jgi:hypothetical protein
MHAPTTMTYTRVLNRGPKAVRSPLDEKVVVQGLLCSGFHP